MMEIKNVSKGYGANPVIHDISFKVESGSIHGLIGHNGCGKTTLIKCMTGIYRADQGEILLDGEMVYENPTTKQKIGYVADSNHYFPSYRVSQMVKFYQQVYPTFSLVNFQELNDIFEVDPRKRIQQLSKGQKMRISFMLNMAIQPEILILDEPTSGLDPIAKKELLHCLVQAVEDRNMAVIISSHNLGELDKVCDTMTLMNRGRVQFQDDLLSIKKHIAKFQIAFIDNLPEGFYQRKDIVHCSNIGSIYTVMVMGDKDAFQEEMKKSGASLVEELEVSLEELFIHTNKGGKMHVQ